LEWRDYTFSGTIIKPVGAIYDSIWVGMDAYSTGNNQYRIRIKNDSMIIIGGGFNNYIPLDFGFNNGDTLNVSLTIYTLNGTKGVQIVPDSMTRVIVDAGINSATLKNYFNNYDISMLRNKEGLPAISIDLAGHDNLATAPIKIKNIKVRK
jgi:uncharacterized circularly permuted ATP-grasp superfamily protein